MMTNNLVSKEEWSRMPITQRYQTFVRRKFQETENSFYPVIEELINKLEDLGEIHPGDVPDFTIHNFTFIREWQLGDVNTKQVLDILKGMNLADVAEKTLCRRLHHFGEGKEKLYSYTYIKSVHDLIKDKSVPLFKRYLELLVMYFTKMYEIDQKQIKLTWIKQSWLDDGEMSRQISEITLNQMFREVDSNILPNNNHRYQVSDNIVVFDESLSNQSMVCHWILGPKNYIDMFTKEFKITEKIDLETEKDYIKNLIGTFTS